MTINSLTSISLAPALLAWSIDRSAASYEVFTNADRFAVSVLSEQQAELAMRFATRGADKFQGLDLDRSLLDESGNTINFPYTYGEEITPLQYGEGLVGKVIERGEPLLINEDLGPGTVQDPLAQQRHPETSPFRTSACRSLSVEDRSV